MANENYCLECKMLIGAPVALQRHDALRMDAARVLPQGDVEYHCRTCGAKLLRGEKRGHLDVRWRSV